MVEDMRIERIKGVPTDASPLDSVSLKLEYCKSSQSVTHNFTCCRCKNLHSTSDICVSARGKYPVALCVESSDTWADGTPSRLLWKPCAGWNTAGTTPLV